MLPSKTTMKIASLVATGFAYYLNNRQYLLHRQTAHSLAVASMKTMVGEQSACISDDCGCDHNHDDTILSSLSARTKDTGREIAFVSELPDLAKIMDDDIQLVVWEQQEQPNFIKVITHHFMMLLSHNILKLIAIILLSKALNDPSIPPERLPSFEGMVPHYLS